MTYLTDLLADSPYGCWPLDDFGATLRDASGGGNPATISGAGYSQQDPPLLPGDAGVCMGWTAPGAVLAMASTPAGTFVPTVQGTFECVVNPTSVPSLDGTGNEVVMGANDGAGHYCLLWLVNSSGMWVPTFGASDGVSTVNLSGPPLPVQRTFHIAAKWDGFNASIWTNGRRNATAPMVFSPGLNDTLDLMGVNAGGFGLRNHYYGYSQYAAYWRTYAPDAGTLARGSFVERFTTPVSQGTITDLVDAKLDAILNAVTIRAY